MNKETIDCQVVMLPTEGKCRIAGKPTEKGQVPEGYRCYSHTGLLKRITKFFANGTPDPDYNTLYLNGYPNPEYNGYSEEYWHPQHLYFTSDEEIKEGDWWISIANGIPPNGPHNRKSMWVSNKKIVASTNLSLGLPAIPESFLKQYVVAQGSIKIVKLETEYTHPDGMTNNIRISKLKLTEANEVIIAPYNDLADLSIVEQNQWIKEIGVVEPKITVNSEGIGNSYTNLHEQKYGKPKFTQEEIQDKELEDAAKEYADYNVFVLNGSLFSNNNDEAGNAFKCSKESFKAGAEWQEQQEANNAIEFADWLCENGWTSSPPMWVNGEASDDCISGQNTYTELTTQQLYELWQKTKE